MSPIIIYIAVFFGVAALVGAVAFIMRGDSEAEVEERLSALDGRQERPRQGRRRSVQRAAQRDARRRHWRRREVRLAVLEPAAAVRAGQRVDVGAEVSVDLRRPGRASACCLPSVGGLQRGAGAADGAVPGVSAGHVAAVQTQAAAEEVRRPTARSAGTDRPRTACRPQLGGRLQPGGPGNVRPDRRRVQPHVRRTKPRQAARRSARRPHQARCPTWT